MPFACLSKTHQPLNIANIFDIKREELPYSRVRWGDRKKLETLPRSPNGQVAVRTSMHRVAHVRNEEGDEAAWPQANQAAARCRQ